MSEKLLLVKRPKLYLLAKFMIAGSMMLQRGLFLFYIKKGEEGHFSSLIIIQIILLPLFVLFECMLFWLFFRRSIHRFIQVLCVLAFQIIFSQVILVLSLNSLPSSEDGQTTKTYSLSQEIFILNCIIILYTDSALLKGSSLLYTTVVTVFRVFPLSFKISYVGWSIMVVMLLFSTVLFECKKKRRKSLLEVKENNYEKQQQLSLDNSLEGEALITKDKEVLGMNGIFKALLGVHNAHEARDLIFKLRKFSSFSATQQKEFFQEIKTKTTILTTKKETSRSYLDANVKSISDSPKSTPKTDYTSQRGYTRRPSNFQNRISTINRRPSILQNRASIVNQRPSIFARRGSNFNLGISTKNIESILNTNGFPQIKVNLSGIQEENRPVSPNNDSDSRIPLMYLLPEPTSLAGESFVFNRGSREIKLSVYATPVSEGDTIHPEHATFFNEMSERVLQRSDSVESAIDSVFASMSKNSDRKHNIVITHLLEGLAFPFELIKKASNYSTANKESKAIGNSSPERFNVVHRDDVRGLRILEVTLTPVIYHYQECVCISLKDVTYEAKIDDLNEALEYKDKLLKFVSHEFRTPLNCSISLLEIVKDLVDKELRTSFVEPSLSSSKLLMTIVNDLLDYSQIQAKKFKISIVPCKMKRVIEEVIEMEKIQALERRIDLCMDWDLRIPQRFYTDPNRLRQILLNLVSNALKFTRKGSITIQATFVSSTITKVAVNDTGTGISEEGLKQLFQEFGKIQETRHLNPQGIGLGLVISKLLSQELGPDSEGLQVESEEGKGTCFYFLIESKIKSCDDEILDFHECESLDENTESPGTAIKTTYERPATKRKRRSSTLAPRLHVESPLIKVSRQQSYQISTKKPEKEEFRANVASILSHSNTMENLDFGLFDRRKISLGDINYIKGNKNLIVSRSSSKEGSKYYRSYTQEDYIDSLFTKSDQEFFSFLKKIQGHCPNPKILIVDDNAFNLKAIQELLKAFGLEAEKVTDGELALQNVVKNEGCCKSCKNYKLIFMDVEMPMLDGFQATQILRKKMLEKEISFIPIIGITGHNPAEKRVECLTSGMNDMTLKPVTNKVMKELLKKWIN